MDTDLVKKNLDETIQLWNACKWHVETLKAVMDKEEGTALSNIKEAIPIKKKPFKASKMELDLVYAQAKNATSKQLEARKNHFYYYDEYLGTLARIEALEGLIERYTQHVKNSQEEESKYITGEEMLAIFKKIDELENVDKGQLITVKSMREEFDSDTIQGGKDRYDFFIALENIYKQNR
jgi:hypothetical protein